MSDYSSSNKRLAKNTIYLTGRMLILLVISLYTSRVTLDALGVDDFGIYNIVGGVVVLFSFISTALDNACNRYFNFSLVDIKPGAVQKSFSTALVAHILLTVIVYLILETAGLWFITNKVNLPPGRYNVSKKVFQFVVFTTCINTLRTPFNSSILAHEKMGFYSLAGLLEGVLKLIIAFCITKIPLDRLLLYSILIAISALLMYLTYATYCLKTFEGNRIILKTDRKSLQELLSFSGWNLIGGIADVGWQQGVNIILNLFFGVILNATMGIMTQIRNATFSFVNNLQSAANPQIIKAFAEGDQLHMHSLIISISKFSFFSMLIISFPLIAGMDFILNLWLVDVPQHCATFSVWLLLFCIVSSLCGPLWVAVQASGKIKTYYIVISIIYLLNVPTTYILYKAGFPAESTMIIRVVIQIFAFVWTLLCTKKLAGLSPRHYATEVLIPASFVSMIAAGLYFLLVVFTTVESTRFFIALFIGDAIILFAIAILGINKHERKICFDYISSLKKK